MADKNGKRSVLDFFVRNSKKFIIGLIILSGMTIAAVGGLWWAYYSHRISPDVVATFTGGQVTISEYKERAFAVTGSGTPQNPTNIDPDTKSTIVNDIVKQKVFEKELSDRGIGVDVNLFIAKAKTLFPDYIAATSDAQAALRDYSKLSVYEDLLSNKVLVKRTGYFLACRFDRSLQSDYDNKPTEAVALNAAQKTYAEQYCNAAYSRLSTGQTNFATELANLKADPKLGQTSWEPWSMTLGRTFDGTNYNPDNFILGSNIFDTINSSKYANVAVYNPFIAKVKKDVNSTEMADGMYVIVGFTDVKSSGETYDFETWSKNLLGTKNVKIYVDRIS